MESLQDGDADANKGFRKSQHIKAEGNAMDLQERKKLELPNMASERHEGQRSKVTFK